MTKAWLNSLIEEGTRQQLVSMVLELDAENDQLRADKRRLDEEVARLRTLEANLIMDNRT